MEIWLGARCDATDDLIRTIGTASGPVRARFGELLGVLPPGGESSDSGFSSAAFELQRRAHDGKCRRLLRVYISLVRFAAQSTSPSLASTLPPPPPAFARPEPLPSPRLLITGHLRRYPRNERYTRSSHTSTATSIHIYQTWIDYPECCTPQEAWVAEDQQAHRMATSSTTPRPSTFPRSLY
jgi:hypothetical protein